MAGGLMTLDNLVWRVNPSDIHWNFSVKTAVQNTVGGRVVQVLGAELDDITITGYYGEDRSRSGGRGGDGPGQSWQMAEAFIGQCRSLMVKQSSDAKTQGLMHQPLVFTYPAKGWHFEVYLKAIRDAGGSRSVEHRTGKFSYTYALTLFIVQDNSAAMVQAGMSNGVIDTKKQQAINSYISRISNGVGWKLTGYNDPTLHDDIFGKNVVVPAGSAAGTP